MTEEVLDPEVVEQEEEEFEEVVIFRINERCDEGFKAVDSIVGKVHQAKLRDSWIVYERGEVWGFINENGNRVYVGLTTILCGNPEKLPWL